MYRINIPGFSYTRKILDSIEFNTKPGEVVGLLGRSGVGKTTLLRLLAGLEPSYESPLEAAYLTQQDALLPWLTVQGNLALGYRLRGEPVQKDLIQDVLQKVQLKEVENLYPHQLSGGMRQRVRLASLLLENKPFVLLDEPFSALDVLTRRSLYTLIREVFSHKAVLLVTHDPWEALSLCDRIYVLSGAPAKLLSEDLKGHDMEDILKVLAA